MIQDSLWKLLSILLIVVLLFIVPMSLMFERQDRIIYNVVQVEVNAFSEMIREVGYIDASMIADFNGTLSSTGLNYDITLEHLVKSFSDDGSGFMRAYYEGTYTGDIMDKIQSEGKYELRIGDFFFVDVVSNSTTKSQTMYKLVGIDSGGPGIMYTSGGIVRYGST